MTISYKIDPDLNLVYYAAFGLCTSSELLQIERKAFKDPLRTENMKIILDVRYAELDVELDDMRSLISINRQLIKDGRTPEKTAIISLNTYINILLDTFHLLADGLPLKTNIYIQPRDALKWLELEEAEERVMQIIKTISQEYQSK